MSLSPSCRLFSEGQKQAYPNSKKIIKPEVQTTDNDDNYSINKAIEKNENSNSNDPFVISDSDDGAANFEPEKETKNFSQISTSQPIPNISALTNPETEYTIYKCKKIKTISFGHKQFIFKLTDSNFNNSDTILYTAKYRSSSIDPIISLFRGNTGHLKEDHAEGVILTSEKLTNFSLRKQSRYGNEVMSLKFVKSILNSKKPRSIQIYASIDSSDTNNSKPIFLRNLEPKRTVFGTWELNLNSKNVYASSKNCRIINDSTKETVFIIRKVEKHVIEIEAMKCFSILQLFALAISSLLCRVK